MKFILYLICLYPLLVFAGPIYFDKDIQPAYERFSEIIKKNKSKIDNSKDKETVRKLSGEAGFMSIVAQHMQLMTSEEFTKLYSPKEEQDIGTYMIVLMAHATQYFYCELYAIDYYKLTEDYIKFLKSSDLDKAIERIEKNASNHSKSIEDCLDYIHEELSIEMKKTSPKLSKIYNSSKYLEARARMFSNSTDKEIKKDPKNEVEDLMLMKLILEKRLQDIEEGLATDDFVKTISQLATDLRAYYRLSNCPDDFAYAFVDYLSALDEFTELAMNKPNDVNAEEAFATVLIWTLAGGNPLEPVLINESVNAEWQRKGKEIQKKITDAENNLNKIAIKYGLRL